MDQLTNVKLYQRNKIFRHNQLVRCIDGDRFSVNLGEIYRIKAIRDWNEDVRLVLYGISMRSLFAGRFEPVQLNCIKVI